MSTAKNVRISGKDYSKVTVVSSDRNYANDPFVVKKVEQAKQFMSKVKLPDHLKK